jgi:hypothetical protein
VLPLPQFPSVTKALTTIVGAMLVEPRVIVELKLLAVVGVPVSAVVPLLPPEMLRPVGRLLPDHVPEHGAPVEVMVVFTTWLTVYGPGGFGVIAHDAPHVVACTPPVPQVPVPGATDRQLIVSLAPKVSVYVLLVKGYVAVGSTTNPVRLDRTAMEHSASRRWCRMSRW